MKASAAAVRIVLVMLKQSRAMWVTRAALRNTRAERGSPWIALITGALIAIIPTAALTDFNWKTGTAAALLGALVNYAITFLRVAIARGVDLWRQGHPFLITQVDPGRDGVLHIWLMLKDGAPPQGVKDLAVLVRKRGGDGYGVRLAGVAGTRTIDRVGPMPPHVIYPDQFPAGAPALQAGEWQIIWSDMRGDKRREFLFYEYAVPK